MSLVSEKHKKTPKPKMDKPEMKLTFKPSLQTMKNYNAFSSIENSQNGRHLSAKKMKKIMKSRNIKRHFNDSVEE